MQISRNKELFGIVLTSRREFDCCAAPRLFTDGSADVSMDSMDVSMNAPMTGASMSVSEDTLMQNASLDLPRGQSRNGKSKQQKCLFLGLPSELLGLILLAVCAPSQNSANSSSQNNQNNQHPLRHIASACHRLNKLSTPLLLRSPSFRRSFDFAQFVRRLSKPRSSHLGQFVLSLDLSSESTESTAPSASLSPSAAVVDFPETMAVSQSSVRVLVHGTSLLRRDEAVRDVGLGFGFGADFEDDYRDILANGFVSFARDETGDTSGDRYVTGNRNGAENGNGTARSHAQTSAALPINAENVAEYQPQQRLQHQQICNNRGMGGLVTAWPHQHPSVFPPETQNPMTLTDSTLPGNPALGGLVTGWVQAPPNSQDTPNLPGNIQGLGGLVTAWSQTPSNARFQDTCNIVTSDPNPSSTRGRGRGRNPFWHSRAQQYLTRAVIEAHGVGYMSRDEIDAMVSRIFHSHYQMTQLPLPQPPPPGPPTSLPLTASQPAQIPAQPSSQTEFNVDLQAGTTAPWRRGSPSLKIRRRRTDSFSADRNLVIPSAALFRLATLCTNVMDLSLSFSQIQNDVYFPQLNEYASELGYIPDDLRQVWRGARDGIIALVSANRASLVAIDLRGVVCIVPEDLLEILGVCSSLRVLNLCGCPNIPLVLRRCWILKCSDNYYSGSAVVRLEGGVEYPMSLQDGEFEVEDLGDLTAVATASAATTESETAAMYSEDTDDGWRMTMVDALIALVSKQHLHDTVAV